MNERLRNAFENEPLPHDLEARVRARLASTEPGRRRAGWPALMGSLAILVVVAGLWQYAAHRRTAELLRVGLNDHVHCGVAGGYPHMTERHEMVEGLGPEFASMLQPVIDRVSTDRSEPDTVESAHRCTVNGRSYIHIVLRRQGTLISVILTRRGESESFPRALAARVIHASGIDIHADSLDGYSVSGFETGGWLGYVVSGLPAPENEAISVRVAPVMWQHAL